MLPQDGRKPKSGLGRCLPTAFVREGTLLIVLKTYFDKSGQEDQSLMTIGGIAANDEVWYEIESDWLHILHSHIPRAEYIHMVEAVFLRGAFDKGRGWDDDKVFGLVSLLLTYLTDYPKKENHRHFACTLNMQDYLKLQAEGYQMPSPADLIANSVVEAIKHWYFLRYQGLDLEAHYYFDIGEPFEPIIKERWEKEMGCGKYNAWSHISHVGSSPMRTTPGLQIADMFAWATNRHEVKLPKRYSDLVTALRGLAPCTWAVVDEAQLRRKYRPLIYRPYERY